LALNIFMVGSFLEGMEESGSVAGTGLASAANFVVSSVLGFLLWEEDFSKEWLLGFSLVIAGSLLLSTVKAGVDEQSKKKED
jgi:drug/metabolite transporter (DMT)-like permease